MRSNERIYWLWCCVGVILAGCGQVMTTTTRTPTLVLLNLTRPSFTPTPILRLLRTPTLLASNTSMPVPTLLPLPLSPPDCYETPVGSLWCLGLVRNTLTVPIRQILISVYLVRADGSVLAEKSTVTANKTVAPGEFSPYGVLFSSIPDGFAGPIAEFTDVRQASRVPMITVQNVQTNTISGGYHVSGQLHSTDSMLLHNLSVVVTLLDPQGHVTGFRQSSLGPDQSLSPGATLPFDLDMIPQGPGTSRIEVTADGE